MRTPSKDQPKPPTRVLCVDDNPEVAAGLRLMIGSDASMTCIGCLTSADGLIDEIRAHDPLPDVVILDATMPGRDPLATIEELATSFPRVKTIVYSGHKDAALIGRALRAGAWKYISKGEEPEAILLAVREVAAG